MIAYKGGFITPEMECDINLHSNKLSTVKSELDSLKVKLNKYKQFPRTQSKLLKKYNGAFVGFC